MSLGCAPCTGCGRIRSSSFWHHLGAVMVLVAPRSRSEVCGTDFRSLLPAYFP
jgi:hypothetical protein